MSKEKIWHTIACSSRELRLDLTLACGQSFRWKELNPGHWTSVLAGHVWTLRQTDDTLYYRVDTDLSMKPASCVILDHRGDAKHTNKGTQNEKTSTCLEEPQEHYEQILRDYFQLGVNLDQLYAKWSDVDPNFKAKAQAFTGVRILRQDPVENLFSFICSSNNNISRISLMVHKMCEKFGAKIMDVDGTTHHCFPTISSLSNGNVEQSLRTLGFGYRAKYIAETAKYIQKNHSKAWLYGLRDKPYAEAKADLMQLCGVGAKVADCVCLMSLDKHGAIPVDTHVWQIVTRDYRQAGLDGSKTVTNTVYRQVGDFFRELWGEYAGWAHSVLFSADLKKFQDNVSGSKKRKTPEKGKPVSTQKVVKKKRKI